jgi:hypothetical protein
MTTVGNVAKTLTCYLEAAEGMSKDEFVTTYAYSVLVEKSAIVSLEKSSLLSVTKLLKDNRDVLHPMTDSSELISNKTKVASGRAL